MNRLITLLATVSVFGAIGSAQAVPDAFRQGVKVDGAYATLHFQTRLGSFRIIDGYGKVEMDFTGTVLLNNFKGDYKFTGNVRKEYDAHDRVIYTGQGHLVASGNWRAVHWFGRNLQGVWWGRGMMRLSGEFDTQQKTGEFWFEDPSKVFYWPGGSTIDVAVPPLRPGYNPDVKIKKKG